jgi:hypothetical protein
VNARYKRVAEYARLSGLELARLVVDLEDYAAMYVDAFEGETGVEMNRLPLRIRAAAFREAASVADNVGQKYADLELPSPATGAYIVAADLRARADELESRDE